MSERKRVAALDAFRGLTIAAMILVNNPGSWSYVYAPLRHAEWHGWTPTDLIFPFFLFIMGTSMAFSLLPALETAAARGPLLRRIARRSALLVALGLFMSAFPRFDPTSMRFPGVLQRIGLVYLAAGTLMVVLAPRALGIVAALLLLGYWALMALVPVPGFGPGNLAPDANLAAWLDRSLFGTHLWRDTWDPEGLLSTLPAIATTLAGLYAGAVLRSPRTPAERTATLFVAGWTAMVAGLMWNPVFPINKNLWTSSYVLFTGGVAAQALAACYWVIDVRGRNRWCVPAIVFGRNAIAVFVLSGLVARSLILIHVTAPDGTSTSLYGWIYRVLFVPWAGPMNGSLAFALATVGAWFAVTAYLYRRRVFMTV